MSGRVRIIIRTTCWRYWGPLRCFEASRRCQSCGLFLMSDFTIKWHRHLHPGTIETNPARQMSPAIRSPHHVTRSGCSRSNYIERSIKVDSHIGTWHRIHDGFERLSNSGKVCTGVRRSQLPKQYSIPFVLTKSASSLAMHLIDVWCRGLGDRLRCLDWMS